MYDAVYFGKQISDFGLKYWLHFTFSSLSTKTVCTTSVSHLLGLAYRFQTQVQNFNFNSLCFFYLKIVVHTVGDTQGLCVLRYVTYRRQ